MSGPNNITAIGGLLISSYAGVTATISANSDRPTVDAQYASRPDAMPQHLASTVMPIDLEIVIAGITTYSIRRAILRALRYPQTNQRLTLRLQSGDPDNLVETSLDVSVTRIDAPAGAIIVNCTAPGGIAQSVTETTIGPYVFTSDGAVAITSSGEIVTFATYKLSATPGSRASKTSSIGWDYTKRITITNNTDRDWKNRAHCVDIGNTATLVSGGKAQSDGDDLRVRETNAGGNGQEIYRDLVNWNTARTFVWFLVTLKAGASKTYDIVYGNSAASTPTNLSTRTGTKQSYIAFDTDGISGTATAGAGSTLSTGVTMEANRWRGGYIQILSGTGSGQRRRIASNTAPGVITVTRAWSTNPNATSVYVIWRSGICVDGGKVSGAGTANTLDDSSQAWNTNQWKGGYLWNVTAGTGPFAITSNTATQITTSTTMSPAPALNDVYYIERYGVHIYNVDPAVYDADQLDLWRRNTYYSKPSRIWYGNQTPGGWIPTLYLDNGEDFAQSRVFDIGAGTSSHAENWRGGLRARRARSQDNTYPEEGQADGVSIYAPEGYQGIYYDFQIKNENGVGKFVLSVLDPGGEDWRDVRTYSTTQASLTPVAAAYRDLSSDDNPTRIYMGALPADGVAIPTSIPITDEIEVRNYEYLQLWLDVSGIGGLTNGIFSAGSEVAIYDLNVTLRLGGGDEVSLTPPYDLLRVGGTNHSLHLSATDVLWISTDPESGRAFAAVYNSSDVLQYLCAWAVRPYRYELGLDGSTVPRKARHVLPIAPVTDLITNGSFTGNITGWTGSAPTGTATWSYDSGVYFDTAGSAKVALATGNDVGRLVSTAFSTVVGEVYTIILAIKTDGTSIDELSYIGLKPYVVDNGGAGSASPLITGFGYILNTVDIGSGTTEWQIFGWEFEATDDSYTLRIDVVNTLTSACNVWIDQVTGGVPGLYVSETSMGEVTVELAYRDRYLV